MQGKLLVIERLNLRPAEVKLSGLANEFLNNTQTDTLTVLYLP